MLPVRKGLAAPIGIPGFDPREFEHPFFSRCQEQFYEIMAARFIATDLKGGIADAHFGKNLA
jgi:hypothetical protein